MSNDFMTVVATYGYFLLVPVVCVFALWLFSRGSRFQFDSIVEGVVGRGYSCVTASAIGVVVVPALVGGVTWLIGRFTGIMAPFYFAAFIGIMFMAPAAWLGELLPDLLRPVVIVFWICFLFVFFTFRLARECEAGRSSD
jgi:hypothetical protein